MGRCIRAFAACAVALACLACALAFVACGTSQKGEVAAAVNDELASFAAQDQDAIAEYFEAGAFDPLDYGVSSRAFASAYFDGFEFQVGDVTADGNTAVAQVTVQTRDQAQFLADLRQAAEDAFAAGAGSADSEAATETANAEAGQAAAAEEATDAGADAAGSAEDGFADAQFYQLYEDHPWDSEQLSGNVTLQCDEDGVWHVQDKGGLCALLLNGYDARQVYS